MAAALLRSFSKITLNATRTADINIIAENTRSFYLQSCLFRARQSTRERKLKYCKKRKAMKEAKRLAQPMIIPYSRKKKAEEMRRGTHLINDEHLSVCEDDVWLVDMYKFRQYSLPDAIEAFRQTHHPTMFNEPEAPVIAIIELDMSTDKKTKFSENFSEIVPVKHPYKHNEDRSILVFSKNSDDIDDALRAGAAQAGSVELITAAKRGRIMLPDFQCVLAHPNILNELSAIRGLFRKKFPTIEKGTLGVNLLEMIEKFRIGIRCESKRDDMDPSFGWVEVQLGYLNMEAAHLEENFRDVLASVRSKGPRRTKNLENYKFMKRCYLTTSLKQEKLVVPIDDYMVEEEIIDSDDEDDDTPAPAAQKV